MAKKLSIRDIATDLNISKTTISFILNGKAKENRISNLLIDKVLKYIEEKKFKPNQLAKSLSTGKTMIIGLMVEKISDYFFAQIAYHIEEIAYQNGYKIIYCSTDDDIQKTRELIALFRERHVDGYIITPPAGIEQEIQELCNDGLPVVLFDRFFPDIDTSYVILDNYQASYDAVSYLISKKYKNIALVELDSEQTQMRDRFLGYQNALAAHDMPSLIKKIPFANSLDQTVEELVAFMKINGQIDALFFATNYLAFSGIKALNQLNLKIPEDIAIIGFDDHEIFNIYKPSITAVAQPLMELANQSINALLNMMNSKKTGENPQKIIVKADLIIRDSTDSSQRSRI
ncbi:MAG TPA: substrate-binding domain-containing protein [Pedobacter sp.]|uniref:LacI family DNA-binding transcriptional regulator n=1 Tax=Pedobacter sp. TaxID=1411316 RepID=UPI002BC6BB00|nr:substrate-binding domain-containing protein [Pedobacter sp.]HMI01148.1 substrate-binding domain-containing protein [Pedobacter sp.]